MEEYRTYVRVDFAPDQEEVVRHIEVSHYTEGEHDGTARCEIAFRRPDLEAIVVSLGPVAATKLGAALLAASFDHRAAIEVWRAEY
jgi:hypothetical protein